MSSESAGSGREYGRVAFVLGCVLALVLAGALLPTITGSFQQGPLHSLVQQGSTTLGGSGSNLTDGSSAGGLGALNPSDSTTVGGLDGSSQSLRSLGPEVHFTVRASQPGYWRTGAYDTYTGTGWERTGERRPYDGPLDVPGVGGERVSYEVELNRTATALPTVWRPRSVDFDGPLSVTERRAIRSDQPLSPGTTFEATSVTTTREPGVLATAGTEYPPGVFAEYTGLPAATPDRLTRFTDRLTADAASPYETARTIESWLEANKTYSLNASAPETDHIADAFVFEMDQGYCEYFATAMTAMLRSQDIPARYVVGYSTGQRTAENTYTVRGMNAHAWVEMYVPDVGWVRFDPTPGSARLSAEQQALESQRPEAAEYNHTEEGSPGESLSPNGTTGGGTPPVEGTVEPGNATTPSGTGDPGGTAPDGSTGDGDPTAPTATPDGDGTAPPDGTTVTPGDGETTPVGGETTPDGTDGDSTDGSDSDSTDSDEETDDPTPTENTSESTTGYDITLSERPVPGSTVTATVTRGEDPAVGVGVLFNGESVGRTGANGTVSGTVPFAAYLNVTVLPPDAALTPAGVPPPGDVQAALPAVNGTNGTEKRFRVETNATLSVAGTVATGQDVLVTATVGTVPVPDATVRLDGEEIGTTDENGRVELTLPDDPGAVTLSVSRDPIGGSRTLSLRALSIEVTPSLPVALPWTDATVTARLDNETAAGVPVTLDGEDVGTTGVDGTLAVSLPAAGSADIAAQQYGQRASTTVSGLWTNLALVVGLLAVLVGGLAALARRRGLGLDSLATLPRAVLAALVGVADLLVRAGRGLSDAVVRGVNALVAFLRGRASLSDLRAALLEWWAEVRAAVRAEFERANHGETAGTTGGATEEHSTLRTSWNRFLSTVSARDPATKTPGELASHAVERDGLPADAVRTVRDAFRAVEYGARDPDEQAPAVESAVETIESAAEGGED